ncbi:monocarboxylate transporter 2 isoform X2 [Esox lucius]|uniref:Major facilitator superfamily (MFS) profile domain-containing protein n=1 Tax=Esox lucius TaxID=8010 RepID=A0A3P8ZMP2_ESOLU|nr:monocarboxylate transporter 2 isoform X2 [Esox lucius]
MGSGVWGLHLHWFLLCLPQGPHCLLQRHPGGLWCLLQPDSVDLLYYVGSHVCRGTHQQYSSQSLWKPAGGHRWRSDVWHCHGFGLSFNLQPSLTIIGKYFHVRRPLANGLAMAGSPVFLCTLAPINQYLFNNFGWRGSFFILGALLLNCCVAGSLMRPIGPHPTGSRRAVTAQTNGAQKRAPADVCEVKVNGHSMQPEKGCMENFNKFLDLSLFKHRGFLIYIVGNTVMFFGFFAPVVFLAPYARSQGCDEYSSAFLLSIMGLVDMFARPGTGLIANTKWIRPRIQYFFSFAIVFNGTCHLLCPLASGYAGLAVYSGFFGIAFGMVCALLFETLMDLVGPQRFSSAVGLATIIECCPVLLGPPIGGALVDTFGDYKYLYLMCGAVMVLAGIFLFIMNVYNYRMLEKEEREGEKGCESQDKELGLGLGERGEPWSEEQGEEPDAKKEQNAEEDEARNKGD